MRSGGFSLNVELRKDLDVDRSGYVEMFMGGISLELN